MKKIIRIVSLILLVSILAVLGIFVFKKSNIESIEIVGDVQTIYFANTATDVNFNNAELKISYKDGSVKLKKITNKLVSVANFNTSVVNNGTMKISYKSHTIDVDYAVINSGLYYLSDSKIETFSGSTITTDNSGTMVAGVDKNNNDITTTVEMINFNLDGTCDYYSRTSKSSAWYLDDGYFDRTFYYKITGNTIETHLGDNKTFNISVKFSETGDASLYCKNYDNYGSTEFIKSTTERTFNHYEMKGNRTFTKDDVSITSSGAIQFHKGDSFSDRNFYIYVKVVYNNDNFLKTVYVRFNESMFKTDKEFDTSVITPSETRAACIYDGVGFYLNYKVVA